MLIYLLLQQKRQDVLTTEDHNIIGGLGSAVSECISSNFPVPVFLTVLKIFLVSQVSR